MLTGEQTFEYSRVAYPGVADGIIQIRNLEAIATIFSLNPVRIDRCRVLEIGCADGPNILPFAFEFPDSEFVGIDLVADRIREGTAAAAAAGLSNVQLRHVNVTEIDASWGTFDYILVPGVFSWSTLDERDAILRVCRDNLSDQGIASVSWNVLPGWNFRGTVREMIRRHVRVFDEPAKQIDEARRAIEFIARASSSSTPHGQMYREIRDSLRVATDHYLFHDYISDRNEPFYFHQFAAMLEPWDLQFVAESDITQVAAMGVSDEATQSLNRAPLLDREQLLDFLVNTSYRRSLLCRSGREVNRRIDHSAMRPLSVALRQPFTDTDFDPASVAPVELAYDGGSLTTVEPLGKAALKHLMSVWPEPVSVAELYPRACRLLPAELHHPLKSDPDSLTDGSAVMARSMLAAWGAGLLRAWKTPPAFCSSLSERPKTSSLVRYWAEHNRCIVNQWHANVRELTDAQRQLLTQLDGETDLETLRSWCASSDLEDLAPENIREMLQQFATHYMLLTE